MAFVRFFADVKDDKHTTETWSHNGVSGFTHPLDAKQMTKLKLMTDDLKKRQQRGEEI